MKREPSRFATIGSRIIVSSSLISCFAALTWADATGFLGGLPGWWLLPILILLAVGGVNEFLGLYAKRRIQLKGGLLRIGVVAIFLAVAVGTQAMVSDTGDTAPVAALSWSALAATVAIGLLFVQEILLTRTSSQSLDRLAAGVFVLTYLGFPMAFMVGLRLVNLASLGFEQTTPKYFGIIPLLSLIAVVKAGDIFAYLIGSAFGRIPLSPKLSPGKTFEGAFASLAGSLFTAWVILQSSLIYNGGLPLQPLGGWFVFGLFVGLAGMVGDLAESLIKREFKTKDSGKSLGALGGTLDLIDSLLFAAPVAWFLWVNAL
ncbi:phosphatidate cytidylyltransferase [Pirellulales bacterium]|nr:phosphatidate cytidylyltransferase [Pirellulales bacterium]